jgi:hypothetical protein
LSFGFRFFMTDGTVAEAVQHFTVTVLDQDDTPPQALTLSTAGAVPYGVAGAVIGTLAVSDPDTAAGFAYTIQEDDAWLFQVVNGTLRLKPGMVLSEADGPIRSVTIDVSDGHQSSAFTVTFGVTDPRAPAGQQVNLLPAGRTKAGIQLGRERRPARRRVQQRPCRPARPWLPDEHQAEGRPVHLGGPAADDRPAGRAHLLHDRGAAPPCCGTCSKPSATATPPSSRCRAPSTGCRRAAATRC